MSSELSTSTDDAFILEQSIKTIIFEIRTNWVHLAGQLYLFHQAKAWQALGYDTMDEWLAGPDIDLSRRRVFSLVDTWRTMVVEGGVSPDLLEGVGPSKLQDTLPAVRRGTITAEQALADADVLSRSDLRTKYEQAPALDGPDEVLEATKEPAWARCPTCNSRYQVQT